MSLIPVELQSLSSRTILIGIVQDLHYVDTGLASLI